MKSTIVKDHRIPIEPVRKCQLGYTNAVNGNVKSLLSIPGLSVKRKPVGVDRVIGYSCMKESLREC